jgi:putative protease
MAMYKVEILAPAGNWAMLRAAVDAGADSVYFGVQGFNMRATAKNFKSSELGRIVEFCHKNKVKAYLTVNTIVYEDEVDKVKKLLKNAKVDAVICWDFAVIKEVKRLGLEMHVSTQASVSNSEAANFYYKLGGRRCVLARECSLEQIREIKEKTKMKIEVFAHGAMCVSVSGRCFISQFLYGRSANRGDCIQPCRRSYDKYLLKDKEEDKELVLGNDYVMSPKDLCTLPFLDKILPFVDVLKIEGRARNPEYVGVVVKAYKESVDAINDGKFTKEFVKGKMKKLHEVYNRGFSSGFFLGKPINEFVDTYGSKAEKRKVNLGVVKNYYRKIGVAEIKIDTNKVKLGDVVLIIGDTTGVVEQKIKRIEINHRPVKSAEKGKSVAVKVEKIVRKNDRVFLWK